MVTISMLNDLRQALFDLSLRVDRLDPKVQEVVDRASALLQATQCPTCLGTGVVVDPMKPVLESEADCLVACEACREPIGEKRERLTQAFDGSQAEALGATTYKLAACERWEFVHNGLWKHDESPRWYPRWYPGILYRLRVKCDD
jgi:hypothetical protein